MYNVERKTRKFSTDDNEAMERYDKIITNPLCSVINSWREKQITTTYDEGRLVGTMTDLVMVLTWEERTLF